MARKNRNRRTEGGAFSPLQLLREQGWRQTGSEPRCAECASYRPASGETRVSRTQGACSRTGLPQVPDGICLDWRPEARGIPDLLERHVDCDCMSCRPHTY